MANQLPPLPPFSTKKTVAPASTAGASPLPALPPLPPDFVPSADCGGGESKGFLDRFTKDVVDIVTGIPGGFIATGEAIGKDIAATTRGDFDFSNSLPIAEQVFKQTIEDLRHPLRRPASSFLTALSVLSLGAGSAARVAAVARAAKAGESAGAISKAALLGPKLEKRVVRAGENAPEISVGYYARPVLTKQIQKLVDRQRELNPDKRFLGVFRPNTDRYGAAVKNKISFLEKEDRALVRNFDAIAKKLSSGEMAALQFYAENVGPDVRSASLIERLAEYNKLPSNTDKAALRDLDTEKALIDISRKYVTSTPDGGADWLPGTEKLQNAYKEMSRLVNRREEILTSHGLMTMAGIATRRQAATDLFFGGRYFSKEDFDQFLKEQQSKIESIDRKIEASKRSIGTKTIRSIRSEISRENRRIAAMENLRKSVAPDAERFSLLQKYFDGEGTGEIKGLDDASINDARNGVSAANDRVDAANAAAQSAVSAAQKRKANAELKAAEAERKAADEKLSVAQDAIDRRDSSLRLEYENLKEFFLHAAYIDEGIINAKNSIRFNQKLLDIARASKGRPGKYVPENLRSEAEDLLAEMARIEKSVVTAQTAIAEKLLLKKEAIQSAIDEKAKDVGKVVGAVGAPTAREYVPYSLNKAAKSAYKMFGSGQRGILGIPKTPGQLKPFTGALMQRGGGRIDKANVLVERTYELIRFASLLKWRNEMINLASKTPAGMKDPVAIRLDVVKNKRIPAAIKEIIEKIDSSIKLTKAEKDLLGSTFDSYQKELFDEELSLQAKKGDIGEIDGYLWIERGFLGGLDKPSPMVALTLGRGKYLFGTIDALNDLSKFVTLYLRPGTIAPNFLSGIALNFIQQGLFAPVNLWNSVWMSRRLGPYETRLIDEYMGEGKSGALAVSGTGAARNLVNIGARAYGKIQDVPFRRSSFLHEARVAGYKSPKQVRDLLTNEKNRDDLFAIQDRANKAIIDYNELNQFEKDFLRRIFYFYPWVKGATKYTVRLAKENPVQAGALTQLGGLGAGREQETFGAVPSWARGIIQVGERDGMPLTVSTGNVLPFTTAADVVKVLTGAASSGGPAAQALVGQFSPVFGSLISSVTGRTDLGVPLPASRGFVEQFLRQVAEGTPQYALAKKLISGTEGRVYPASRDELLRAYLLSNILAPRPVDVGMLQSFAEREAQK